jgi:hypothetical protein
VKRELTVTPLDVSSLSVWVLASNRTVSPPVLLVVPAVSVVLVAPAASVVVVVVVLVVEPVAPGTKKEALPVVRPPVTAISARAVVAIAKLPAKRPKQTTYRVDELITKESSLKGEQTIDRKRDSNTREIQQLLSLINPELSLTRK